MLGWFGQMNRMQEHWSRVSIYVNQLLVEDKAEQKVGGRTNMNEKERVAEKVKTLTVEPINMKGKPGNVK